MVKELIKVKKVFIFMFFSLFLMIFTCNSVKAESEFDKASISNETTSLLKANKQNLQYQDVVINIEYKPGAGSYKLNRENDNDLVLSEIVLESYDGKGLIGSMTLFKKAKNYNIDDNIFIVDPSTKLTIKSGAYSSKIANVEGITYCTFKLVFEHNKKVFILFNNWETYTRSVDIELIDVNQASDYIDGFTPEISAVSAFEKEYKVEITGLPKGTLYKNDSYLIKYYWRSIIDGEFDVTVTPDSQGKASFTISKEDEVYKNRDFTNYLHIREITYSVYGQTITKDYSNGLFKYTRIDTIKPKLDTIKAKNVKTYKGYASLDLILTFKEDVSISTNKGALEFSIGGSSNIVCNIKDSAITGLRQRVDNTSYYYEYNINCEIYSNTYSGDIYLVEYSLNFVDLHQNSNSARDTLQIDNGIKVGVLEVLLKEEEENIKYIYSDDNINEFSLSFKGTDAINDSRIYLVNDKNNQSVCNSVNGICTYTYDNNLKVIKFTFNKANLKNFAKIDANEKTIEFKINVEKDELLIGASNIKLGYDDYYKIDNLLLSGNNKIILFDGSEVNEISNVNIEKNDVNKTIEVIDVTTPRVIKLEKGDIGFKNGQLTDAFYVAIVNDSISKMSINDSSDYVKVNGNYVEYVKGKLVLSIDIEEIYKDIVNDLSISYKINGKEENAKFTSCVFNIPEEKINGLNTLEYKVLFKGVEIESEMMTFKEFENEFDLTSVSIYVNNIDIKLNDGEDEVIRNHFIIQNTVNKPDYVKEISVENIGVLIFDTEIRKTSSDYKDFEGKITLVITLTNKFNIKKIINYTVNLDTSAPRISSGINVEYTLQGNIKNVRITNLLDLSVNEKVKAKVNGESVEIVNNSIEFSVSKDDKTFILELEDEVRNVGRYELNINPPSININYNDDSYIVSIDYNKQQYEVDNRILLYVYDKTEYITNQLIENTNSTCNAYTTKNCVKEMVLNSSNSDKESIGNKTTMSFKVSKSDNYKYVVHMYVSTLDGAYKVLLKDSDGNLPVLGLPIITVTGNNSNPAIMSSNLGIGYTFGFVASLSANTLDSDYKYMFTSDNNIDSVLKFNNMYNACLSNSNCLYSGANSLTDSVQGYKGEISIEAYNMIESSISGYHFVNKGKNARKIYIYVLLKDNQNNYQVVKLHEVDNVVDNITLTCNNTLISNNSRINKNDCSEAIISVKNINTRIKEIYTDGGSKIEVDSINYNINTTSINYGIRVVDTLGNEFNLYFKSEVAELMASVKYNDEYINLDYASSYYYDNATLDKLYLKLVCPDITCNSVSKILLNGNEIAKADFIDENGISLNLISGLIDGTNKVIIVTSNDKEIEYDIKKYTGIYSLTIDDNIVNQIDYNLDYAYNKLFKNYHLSINGNVYEERNSSLFESLFESNRFKVVSPQGLVSSLLENIVAGNHKIVYISETGNVLEKSFNLNIIDNIPPTISLKNEFDRVKMGSEFDPLLYINVSDNKIVTDVSFSVVKIDTEEVISSIYDKFVINVPGSYKLVVDASDGVNDSQYVKEFLVYGPVVKNSYSNDNVITIGVNKEIKLNVNDIFDGLANNTNIKVDFKEVNRVTYNYEYDETSGIISITYLRTGNYVIYITGYDINNNETTATLKYEVVVDEKPIINSVVINGKSITVSGTSLDVISTGEPINIDVSVSDGYTNSMNFVVTKEITYNTLKVSKIDPSKYGKYTLTVSANNGYKNSDVFTVVVNLNKDIFAPEIETISLNDNDIKFIGDNYVPLKDKNVVKVDALDTDKNLVYDLTIVDKNTNVILKEYLNSDKKEINIDKLKDGKYLFKIRCKDSFENEANSIISIIIDSTIPSINGALESDVRKFANINIEETNVESIKVFKDEVLYKENINKFDLNEKGHYYIEVVDKAKNKNSVSFIIVEELEVTSLTYDDIYMLDAVIEDEKVVININDLLRINEQDDLYILIKDSDGKYKVFEELSYYTYHGQKCIEYEGRLDNDLSNQELFDKIMDKSYAYLAVKRNALSVVDTTPQETIEKQESNSKIIVIFVGVLGVISLTFIVLKLRRKIRAA